MDSLFNKLKNPNIPIPVGSESKPQMEALSDIMSSEGFKTYLEDVNMSVNTFLDEIKSKSVTEDDIYNKLKPVEVVNEEDPLSFTNVHKMFAQLSAKMLVNLSEKDRRSGNITEDAHRARTMLTEVLGSSTDLQNFAENIINKNVELFTKDSPMQ